MRTKCILICMIKKLYLYIFVRIYNFYNKEGEFPKIAYYLSRGAHVLLPKQRSKCIST